MYTQRCTYIYIYTPPSMYIYTQWLTQLRESSVLLVCCRTQFGEQINTSLTNHRQNIFVVNYENERFNACCVECQAKQKCSYTRRTTKASMKRWKNYEIKWRGHDSKQNSLSVNLATKHIYIYIYVYTFLSLYIYIYIPNMYTRTYIEMYRTIS